jgi:hypothetical protein
VKFKEEVMAIVRRQQQQLSSEEETAVLEFFKTNQELDPKHQVHNANKLEAALHHMNAVVTQESLQVAFEILKKVGELRLITPEKKKFDAAVKLAGLNQSHVNTIFNFLRTFHLVHDASDQGLHNATIVIDGLSGREFNPGSMRFAIEHAQSRGTTLYWEQRDLGTKPRGKHSTDEPVHFMPKDESNRGYLQGHSHSRDPRFNGQLEREQREAVKTASQKSTEDVMEGTNAVWRMSATQLSGENHTQTKRIQSVVQQVAMREGWRKAYEAGRNEQKRIENERAGSR